MKVDSNLSRWPIVEVTFPADVTIADIAAHFDFLDEVFRTKGRFLTISNINDLSAESATPVARRVVAERIDRLSVQGAFIAEFVVVRSTIMRGVFTAYSWLRKHRHHDMRAFSTLQEAYEAAQVYLDRPAKQTG